MLFTALDLASITSHIHSWVLFFLWLRSFILSGVISPLISSSNLGTYRPGSPSFSILSFDRYPTKQCQTLFCETPKSLLMVIAAIKLKDYPWKESYDQPRQHIKKQRHYFANKGPSSQGYGFSSSHVWMWELDYEESWVPKNWCFSTVVLEKTLLISWLQSPSAVISEPPPQKKSVTVSTISPSIFHEVMGPGAMILVFWMQIVGGLECHSRRYCPWSVVCESLHAFSIRKLTGSSI